MFITGPPMSLSPRPPPALIAISSALTVSYTTDAKPPLRAAVSGNPLTAYRPSPPTEVALIVLERALNEVIVGDSAAPVVSPTLIPGVALSSAPAARVAGICCTVLLLSTVSFCALWTSTTGVSPVTVIVSATPPTFISTGIVIVEDPVNWMPSRLTVVKPESVKLSE